MTHVILSREKGGSMMYDCAEELGKSTVWHGASLSLALFHTLWSRYPSSGRNAEVLYLCVWEPENRSAFLFFVLVYCSISLFFSHTVLFFKKGRGNRPTKERKEKKNYVWERNRQVLKKTWLRVVREGEVINQSQVWQQRDYYFK